MKAKIKDLSAELTIYTSARELMCRIVCHTLVDPDFRLEVGIHHYSSGLTGSFHSIKPVIYSSRSFASKKLVEAHARALFASIIKFGKRFFTDHAGDPIAIMALPEDNDRLTNTNPMLEALERNNYGTLVNYKGEVQVEETI